MNKIVASLLISLLWFISECQAGTPVRKCAGVFPYPLNVQIDDCVELPCIITKGETAQMDVQFVAIKDNTYEIQANVRVTALGITIPYPLPNEIKQVCKNLMFGAYCPLDAGEDVTYHLEFPVDEATIEVNCKAEVKLLDMDGDVVTCFIADFKVKPRNLRSEMWS